MSCAGCVEILLYYCFILSRKALRDEARELRKALKSKTPAFGDNPPEAHDDDDKKKEKKSKNL